MGHHTFDFYFKDFKPSSTLSLKDIIIEKDKSSIQVNGANDGQGNIPFFTSGESILFADKPLISGFNIFLSTGGNAKVQSYFGEASYSTDTWVISARDELSYYLYEYLKHIESQMDKLYFHGTGLKHLQKPIFLKSSIKIPHSELLKKYNSVLVPLNRQISSLKKENFQLQKLKEKLLPLLINQQLS